MPDSFSYAKIDVVDDQQLEKILGKFDQVIELLKDSAQPVSKMRRTLELLATIAGIAGLVAVIDVLRSWLGG